MSSDPFGGGRPPSGSSAGGSGAGRSRPSGFGSLLLGLGGFVGRYGKYFLLAIFIVVGLWFSWASLNNLGQSFKQSSMIQQNQVGPEANAAKTGEKPQAEKPQEYGSDSSNEESGQTTAAESPTMEDTPEPTPVPTPLTTMKPTAPPVPTPMPTEKLFAADPKDQEEAPEEDQEQSERAPEPPTISPPKPRRSITVIPPRPPIPVPSTVLETTREKEQPKRISQEELDRITEQEIRKMKGE